MRIGIGKEAPEQHLVGADADAWHEVVRFERRLLNLGMKVSRVAIERQPADLLQRVVGMRPHLGQVEGIEPIGLRVFERHDLHLQRPARVIHRA